MFVYTVVRTLVYRVHSWSIVNLERHLLIDRTFVKFDFCTVATLLNLNRTLQKTKTGGYGRRGRREEQEGDKRAKMQLLKTQLCAFGCLRYGHDGA